MYGGGSPCHAWSEILNLAVSVAIFARAFLPAFFFVSDTDTSQGPLVPVILSLSKPSDATPLLFSFSLHVQVPIQSFLAAFSLLSVGTYVPHDQCPTLYTSEP